MVALHLSVLLSNLAIARFVANRGALDDGANAPTLQAREAINIANMKLVILDGVEVGERLDSDR